MNALSQSDLHRLKWLLGQVLALIAFWAMLELDFGNQPLLLIFSSLIVVSLLFPALASRIPALFWKATTPALIAIIVLDFILHGADFLRPLVRMVMLLTVLRCLQYRARREDLQVVLLCLFILVISGVLTVSLTFGLQMLLFTPLAMGLLFVINLLEASYDRKLTREDWSSFRWRSFFHRLRTGMDFRMLGFAGALFAGVVAVSSLIFVAIPRFNIDQALPFLQMPGTGTVGFSDSISYGDVSSLQDDDSVAVRVEVANVDDLPSDPYWRMVVLDEYTDKGFRMSMSLKRDNLDRINGTQINSAYWGRRTAAVDRDAQWVFYMEGNVSKYLPLPGPFATLRFQKKSKYQTFPLLNLVSLDAVSAKVFGYSVEGPLVTDRLAATNTEVMGLAEYAPVASPLNEEDKPLPLKYPMTTRTVPAAAMEREYLEAVVAEITEGQQLEPEAFIQATSEWLRKNYRYNRKVRDLSDREGDPLILWMREDNQGWCEHFAGAFAMLSRTAGYPTRVIAGFAGADWNDYEDYYVIRNSNAHAWVEMYDRNGNWLRVDPTPSSSGSGAFDASMAAASVGTFSGWNAWVDSLRMVWYRRVINFDESDQAQMAENLGSYFTSTYTDFKTYVKAKFVAFKAWLTQGWDREKALQLVLNIAILCFVFLGLRMVFLWVRGVLSRRGSLLGFAEVDPIRRKAGRLLLKYKAKWELAQSDLNAKQTTRWRETHDALLALRFGEVCQRNEARTVFRRARQLMRESR